MGPFQKPWRACLLGPLTCLLALSVSSAGPSGPASPSASTAGWERKLDPFLRRLSLGTVKVQGPFRESVPARSNEAVRALPPFVLTKKAAVPTVMVKAGIGALPAGRGWEALGTALSGAG